MGERALRDASLKHLMEINQTSTAGKSHKNCPSHSPGQSLQSRILFCVCFELRGVVSLYIKELLSMGHSVCCSVFVALDMC